MLKLRLIYSGILKKLEIIMRVKAPVMTILGSSSHLSVTNSVAMLNVLFVLLITERVIRDTSYFLSGILMLQNKYVKKLFYHVEI